MAHRTITSWLKTWQRKQCAFTSGLAVLAMVVGCVVLLVTFWLAYGVILIGMDAISAGSALLSGKPLGISHGWRLVLSLLFIVLLFIETAWSHAEPPPAEPRPQLSNTYTDLSWRLARLRAELIIIAHPVDSARRISYWLRMGPRCVFRSGRLFAGCCGCCGCGVSPWRRCLHCLRPGHRPFQSKNCFRHFPQCNGTTFSLT
jgi:hypothetical protein